MADIKRKLSELLIDYADNNIGAITPNKLRNGFKSVFGSTDVNIITSSTYQATPDDVVMIYNYENSSGYILIPAVSADDGTGDTFARKEYVVSNTADFNVTLIDLGHSSEMTTVEPGDFVYIAADSTNWNVIFKLQSSKFVHIDGSLPMTGTLKTPAVSAALIEFDTSVSQIPLSAGQARWNPIDKTFDFGLEDDVTGQLFEEFFIGAHNETGETIQNGRAVFITSGSDDDQLHVAIASKDSQLSKKTIAIATHDVLDGQFAKFTKIGKIHDVDTSQVLPGRPIYLGLSGAFTSAEAEYPDYNILLGYCIIQHETSGVIYVDVEPENAIEDIYNVNITDPTQGDSFIFENNRWINRNFGRITKESTGFEDPYNITVTYDELTRTITITGANINSYWRSNATPISGTSWTSPSHAPGTSGNLFLYYDGTDFIWSSSPWSYDMLQIALVNYNRHGQYILSLRECHGTMPWQVHEEFHTIVGTYLKTGGDLSNYTLNSTVTSARRPYISTTNVKDEDLETQNAALMTASYTRIGLSGTGYRFITTDSSDIVALSGTQPMYDYYNGATWNKALVTNNNYVAVFVVAVPTASDTMSQKCRYMFVQPQKVFGTFAEAELYTSNNLTFGDISNMIPEFVFIGKIIILYTAGNWSLVKVEKLSGSSRTQASTVGTYLTTVTHDNSLSGAGTAGSPLGVVSANIVHDSSISGLGNTDSPLGVVSATVVHDSSISGLGNSASPLSVVSATVYHDSSISGLGNSASPLSVVSAAVVHDSSLSGLGNTDNPLTVVSANIVHDSSISGLGNSASPLSVVSATVYHDTSISGLGNSASPLSVVSAAVIHDSSLSGIGNTDSPLTVVSASITHDESLSGLGNTDSPLTVVSASITHDSSLSGLGNTDSPLGVVSATVYHDVTLSGTGSVDDPLGVIVDTQSVTVLTDSTLTGNGSSAYPLSVVSATVYHDTSISGLGNSASPLSVVSATVYHDTSLSGVGSSANPLGVVSATVYHDVTLSGTGSSASPLGVIVDTQSVTVLTDSTLSGNGSSAYPLSVDIGFQDLNNMHSYNPINGNTLVYVSANSGWEPYANIYALEYVTTLFYQKYSNWDTTYETMFATSGNWQSTYTTVSSNSASWGGSATGDYIVSHTSAESAYQVSAIAVVSALPATQLPNVLYFLMS